MACSAPVARSAITMRLSAFSRTRLTNQSRATPMPTTKRPGWCASHSRQCARPGASTGACITLKSTAPSALVWIEQLTVPLLDRIAQAGRARLDEARLGGRVGGGDQPHLRSLVVAGADHDEGVGVGAPDREEEAVVGLVVDQDVVGCATAGGAPIDLGRAAVVVAPDPEQPGGVGREGEGAGCALDRLGQHLAGREILHVDAVDFRPLLVDGIGEEAVVGAVLGRSDVEVGLALRRSASSSSRTVSGPPSRGVRAWIGCWAPFS